MNHYRSVSILTGNVRNIMFLFISNFQSEDLYGVSLDRFGNRTRNIMFLKKVLPHGFGDKEICGTSMVSGN